MIYGLVTIWLNRHECRDIQRKSKEKSLKRSPDVLSLRLQAFDIRQVKYVGSP